jgi:hypothetical protein
MAQRGGKRLYLGYRGSRVISVSTHVPVTIPKLDSTLTAQIPNCAAIARLFASKNQLASLRSPRLGASAVVS